MTSHINNGYDTCPNMYLISIGCVQHGNEGPFGILEQFKCCGHALCQKIPWPTNHDPVDSHSRNKFNLEVDNPMNFVHGFVVLLFYYVLCILVINLPLLVLKIVHDCFIGIGTSVSRELLLPKLQKLLPETVTGRNFVETLTFDCTPPLYWKG